MFTFTKILDEVDITDLIPLVKLVPSPAPFLLFTSITATTLLLYLCNAIVSYSEICEMLTICQRLYMPPFTDLQSLCQ